MSLVGPRPERPFFVDKFVEEIESYNVRHFLKSGITGWAQVNGGRIISTYDKLNLDIWYVQNASLMLDLAIVLRTVRIILFGDRINTDAVNQARSNFGGKTALQTKLVPAE